MKFSYSLFLPSCDILPEFIIYIYIYALFRLYSFSFRPSQNFLARSQIPRSAGKSMKNNFACSLRYFREKERVTRCALYVFHSVKRTANNFVINCIKLSVRKTVYAPASSRVCGTINWTARARFVFFFPLFPPLFFFLFFFSTEPENLMFRIRRTH